MPSETHKHRGVAEIPAHDDEELDSHQLAITSRLNRI